MTVECNYQLLIWSVVYSNNVYRVSITDHFQSAVLCLSSAAVQLHKKQHLDLKVKVRCVFKCH